MDVVLGWLAGWTIWHWIALAIILLAVEVAVGTFDLLWVAMAAFVTALYLLIAPESLGGWQTQLTVFGVVSVAFVIVGRTLFKGLRQRPDSHPTLNDRMATLVGQRGAATVNFEQGKGRVKIGDTVWAAMQLDDGPILSGDEVTVESAQGPLLRVRKA
jgi:membrane protein implicated in regulation of membrane protease activity